jgi:hypothetical protein
MAAAWRWLSEVLAFQFTGWPYTRVPAVVPIAAALVLLALAARTRRRAFVWLVATWVVYAAADVAGVFPHGFRWGLILFPLLVPVLGAGFSAGTRTVRGRVVGTAAFAALVLAGVVSLPHRTVRERVYADQTWAWPETEDMRVVVRYWDEHRTETQPTYVYYGAAPAFAYYTRAIVPREGLPPTWHLSCWHDGSLAFCHDRGVYYGRWLRNLTTDQQLNSVFNTLGERPRAFWIVFAHITPYDDRDMIAALLRRGYRIETAVQARDAAAFLLTRS